jgi:preprotein translocase subunit Sec63
MHDRGHKSARFNERGSAAQKQPEDEDKFEEAENQPEVDAVFDPYSILGVNWSSSPAEIEAAYKELRVRWHPDKNLEGVREATARFQAVQGAWEMLSSK